MVSLLRPRAIFSTLSHTRSPPHHLSRATLFTMAANPPSNKNPIVISGPSGVGKGTLYNRLFKTHPNTFTLSVSHTTRDPRPGETDGVDYHFVTMQQFEDLIGQDGFVEHAKFGGNRYGTSKQTIREQEEKGKVVVLDIEMEGVKQIKEVPNFPARFIYIAPPNKAALEARLRARGTEKEESIQKRLEQAKNEAIYAASGAHDKIIVNDNVDEAYKELEQYIYGN